MKRLLISLLIISPALVSFQEETYLPGPDCESFYACIDDVCVLHTCSPGLYFNWVEQRCDWPDLSNCGGGDVNKSFALINPPNSSIDMVISGGTQMDGKATNNNILGVTLVWTKQFTSSTTIYAGILLPGNSITHSDYIWGTVPRTYHHSASTSSDAANITFNYRSTYL
ncbi:chitin binding domain-containing protein [Chitinophaga horti]|uniref:Chitin binding domain-containing protein n=1 Tax=Chitinophaga horti TaxID=2920382 RepID=A0ABY6IVL6_9BACT|nr:chitin binding peritrophin-A domain-containing protein [Chitinophaga horti]UYQ91422.1 chitin binding domain-containing protein [Chitinophaga horti]